MLSVASASRPTSAYATAARRPPLKPPSRGEVVAWGERRSGAASTTACGLVLARVPAAATEPADDNTRHNHLERLGGIAYDYRFSTATSYRLAGGHPRGGAPAHKLALRGAPPRPRRQ